MLAASAAGIAHLANAVWEIASASPSAQEASNEAFQTSTVLLKACKRLDGKALEEKGPVVYVAHVRLKEANA